MRGRYGFIFLLVVVNGCLAHQLLGLVPFAAVLVSGSVSGCFQKCKPATSSIKPQLDANIQNSTPTTAYAAGLFL